MAREIVRRLTSGQTHLADVEEPYLHGIQFGSEYRAAPTGTRSLCGVDVSGGVVMREGTKTRCRACRYLGDRRSEVTL